MQYVKENGRFRFSPEEWLTAKQIKSFFSTITQNRRRSSNTTSRNAETSQKRILSKKMAYSDNDIESSAEQTNIKFKDTSDYDSYVENIHPIEQDLYDSNVQCESDTEEENETDFDATMVVMDMEEMLTTAKTILVQ